MKTSMIRKVWASLAILMVLAMVLTACSGGTQQAAQADPFENIKRIQTAKVLKVGTGAGYYPFEMIDKSGKTVGFDMDIAQAMADALGVELQVVDFKDFDAILPALGAGQIDMILAGHDHHPPAGAGGQLQPAVFPIRAVGAGEQQAQGHGQQRGLTWTSRSLRS